MVSFIGTKSRAAALLIAMVITITMALHGFESAERGGERSVAAAEIEPQSPIQINNALTASNCRYGVGLIPESYAATQWMSTVKSGWYVNFSHYKTYESPTADFVFTIRLRQAFGPGGVRLDEYTVNPRLIDYYEEGGDMKPGLGAFLQLYPGATWAVGNEIEIDNHLQDNIMPDLYAKAYHDVYHYIKSVDPTAKVAIGSLLQTTPGRLQYLDIMFDTYESLYGEPMPVDVWNTHLYILAERTMRPEPQYADGKIALGTDPELAIFSTGNRNHCPAPGVEDIPQNDPRPDVFCRAERDSTRIISEQLYSLRGWMKDRGLQNVPLIITEYSILAHYNGTLADGTCDGTKDEFGNCFDPDRVARYLVNSTNFMETTKDETIGYPADDYRLVQRWAWYSIHTPYLVANASNLLVKDFDKLYPSGSVDALTAVGHSYRFQAEKYATVNLVGESAGEGSIFVEYPEDKGTATITASFRNTGSYSVIAPFTVTFYSDAALTNPIGTAEVNPENTGPVLGCSWLEASETVTLSWPDLPVGTHYYWAKIDSNENVGETNEADNVTTRGQVDVFAQSEHAYLLYLPISRTN